MNLNGNGPTATLDRYAPVYVKRQLVEKNWPAAEKAIERALGDDGHPCPLCMRNGNAAPWAVNLMAKAAGVIDTPTVMVQINQRLGVADEAQAIHYIELGRKHEQLTEGDIDITAAVDSAVQVLQEALRAKPDLRNDVLSRLGSFAEVEE